MENRICKKCLIGREISEDLTDYVRRYFDNMDEEEQVSDEEYKKRLEICKDCSMLSEAVCRACGCYAQIRAAAAKQSCPYEKWGKQLSQEKK